MAFPEEQPASFGQKLKNFFFGSSDVDQLKPLSFSAAQELSLGIFLEEHYQVLRRLDYPISSQMSNLEKFVTEVYIIYEQLRKRQTCIKDRKDQDWTAFTIAKVCWCMIIGV